MGPGSQSGTCKGPGACVSSICKDERRMGRSLSFILDRVGLWIIRNFFWLPGDESWVRRGAGPRGQAKDQCGLDQLGEEIQVGRSGCIHRVDSTWKSHAGLSSGWGVGRKVTAVSSVTNRQADREQSAEGSDFATLVLPTQAVWDTHGRVSCRVI